VTWALLVAGKGGKRSRLAREVADALGRRGLAVAGMVQRTVEDEGGGKWVEADRLRRPGTLRLAGPAGPDASCALAFDPAAFAEAGRWLAEDAPGADVLVVDGLGKLELAGSGNRTALSAALSAGPPVVLAVRDDQLAYALEALGIEEEPVAVFTEGEGPAALEAFVGEVAHRAGAR
jgi:nucleoside-triphosphatase THEP1